MTKNGPSSQEGVDTINDSINTCGNSLRVQTDYVRRRRVQVKKKPI